MTHADTTPTDLEKSAAINRQQSKEGISFIERARLAVILGSTGRSNIKDAVALHVILGLETCILLKNYPNSQQQRSELQNAARAFLDIVNEHSHTINMDFQNKPKGRTLRQTFIQARTEYGLPMYNNPIGPQPRA